MRRLMNDLWVVARRSRDLWRVQRRISARMRG